jgi:hypothetical protein
MRKISEKSTKPKVRSLDNQMFEVAPLDEAQGIF